MTHRSRNGLCCQNPNMSPGPSQLPGRRAHVLRSSLLPGFDTSTPRPPGISGLPRTPGTVLLRLDHPSAAFLMSCGFESSVSPGIDGKEEKGGAWHVLCTMPSWRLHRPTSSRSSCACSEHLLDSPCENPLVLSAKSGHSPKG